MRKMGDAVQSQQQHINITTTSQQQHINITSTSHQHHNNSTSSTNILAKCAGRAIRQHHDRSRHCLDILQEQAKRAPVSAATSAARARRTVRDGKRNTQNLQVRFLLHELALDRWFAR
jgi:hypothetical protein